MSQDLKIETSRMFRPAAMILTTRAGSFSGCLARAALSILLCRFLRRSPEPLSALYVFKVERHFLQVMRSADCRSTISNFVGHRSLQESQLDENFDVQSISKLWKYAGNAVMSK